jgi:hypothetical protein
VNIKFWKKSEAAGSALISDGASSQVSDGTGLINRGIYPDPPFPERLEAYDTIGKIFAAVESYVKAVNKRDFYLANTDPANTDSRGIRLMQEWERQHHASQLIDCICHDLLITGNAIVASTDWLPVQMSSVKYMRRRNRKPETIMLEIDSKEVPLGFVQVDGKFEQKIPLDSFIHLKYIDVNQEAWGRGLFHPVLTAFEDVDGKRSMPIYKWVRQMEQDGGRIYHRMAAPRVFVSAPGITNKDEFDTDNPRSLASKLKHMQPGDRVLVQSEIQLLSEPVDGKSRFQEIKQDINDELEVATQSSSSRLITRPSSMADAREAGRKDDDTALDLMEKIRRFMDDEVIPRVLAGTGIDPRSVEFRWGKEDDYRFDFGHLLQAHSAGFISPEEGRQMLKSAGWKLDDRLFGRPQPKEESQCQWITFGGRRICIKHSHGDAIDREYDDALENHDDFEKTARLRNYTYDPIEKRGYEFADKNDALEFRDKFSKTDDDLIIVSTTNNKGKFGEKTRSAFKRVRTEGRDPLMGKWTSTNGTTFRDISYAINVKSDGEVKNLLRKFKQQTGVVITKEGKIRFVHNR